MAERRHIWIFDFITMVAVIAGVVYGAVELRNLRDAREREAMFRLYEISQTEAYAEALALIRALPDSLPADELRVRLSGPESSLSLRYLTNTWEGLGILTFRRQVPLPWVDEFYGGPILESWRKLEPLILETRISSGRKSRNEWFQWLAERLREYEAGGERPPAYSVHRSWRWDK